MPTPIEVIMRMTPDTQKVISGEGTRPAWFSKEACFRSVVAATSTDPDLRITVLFDGTLTPDHWLHTYSTSAPLTVHTMSAGNGHTSFKKQYEYALQQDFDPQTIVYILEDDYLHMAGWPTALREAFDGPLEHESTKFDYVTLYDHRDKYFYDMYTNLESKIAITPSSYWRSIPSTTNTFAARAGTLDEDAPIHLHFLNADHEKFLTLGSQAGRRIASAMPGWSTHSHMSYLSPFRDWEAAAAVTASRT